MAAETRSRGWRRTIRIKQFLTDDGSDENARGVAHDIAAVLKRQREYGSDEEFTDIAEEFADIEDGIYDEPRWTPCAHLNAVLSSLYDWSDAERVWIA